VQRSLDLLLPLAQAGILPGDGLQQGHADGKHVGFGGALFPDSHFWRHEGHGSSSRSVGRGHGAATRRGRRGFCQTKVADFQNKAIGGRKHEQVLRFQVFVANEFAVQEAHTVAQVVAPEKNQGDGERGGEHGFVGKNIPK